MDDHAFFNPGLMVYSGEIAEMGEQLWYRLAARVSAGRGKWEARFARGVWVGKSEIDDTHLVVDLERGIQKDRTARKDARGNSVGMQRVSGHSVHTLETHTGKICTSCWTKHVHHGENDRCSWTDG